MLDVESGLMVRPVSKDFEFIYRDASGIRWNPQHKALIAYEPLRWDSKDLFEQILFAVRNEYGITLFTSASTTYTNISEDLKSTLIKVSYNFDEVDA